MHRTHSGRWAALILGASTAGLTVPLLTAPTAGATHLSPEPVAASVADALTITGADPAGQVVDPARWQTVANIAAAGVRAARDNGALDDTVATLPGVGRSRTTDGAETTWMRACFTVEADAPWTRSELQDLLEARGVATRMVWTGNVLRQPGFAGIEHRAPEGGLPNCDHLMDHALSLPIHHGMDSSHMTYICDQLREVADLA